MKRGVKPTKQPDGAIRIISGRWRGTKLAVAGVPGLRPTTDRNKETLFNWLMPFINGARCLDVFAGSGGLGFEALSRYACSVTFIELDRVALNQLQQNRAKLKIDESQAPILAGDALRVLATLNQTYDLIFLDPPFHQNLLPKTLEQIDSLDLVAPDGLVYIECEVSAAYILIPHNWQLLKERASSQWSARLYQRSA